MLFVEPVFKKIYNPLRIEIQAEVLSAIVLSIHENISDEKLWNDLGRLSLLFMLKTIKNPEFRDKLTKEIEKMMKKTEQ
ncbi:hypothetical protein ES705_06575 [subsurface metagenome]